MLINVKMIAFCDVTALSAVMMETVSTSETSVGLYETTLRVSQKTSRLQARFYRTLET
jgi:hypothetical protein